MSDPIKKAIFGYADLGKAEDAVGVKAIDQYEELKTTATHLWELLGRANMALLCYTQSHGTPHTQLMDEIAEELGLDADGNTLKELADG